MNILVLSCIVVLSFCCPTSVVNYSLAKTVLFDRVVLVLVVRVVLVTPRNGVPSTLGCSSLCTEYSVCRDGLSRIFVTGRLVLCLYLVRIVFNLPSPPLLSPRNLLLHSAHASHTASVHVELSVLCKQATRLLPPRVLCVVSSLTPLWLCIVRFRGTSASLCTVTHHPLCVVNIEVKRAKLLGAPASTNARSLSPLQ